MYLKQKSTKIDSIIAEIISKTLKLNILSLNHYKRSYFSNCYYYNFTKYNPTRILPNPDNNEHVTLNYPKNSISLNKLSENHKNSLNFISLSLMRRYL